MVGEGALLVFAAPFIKKLFTSTLGLVPGAGEGEDDGVAGALDLEADLLRVDLDEMPFAAAGMVPKDLTLDASEDTAGTEAGLEEMGADGSAIDPNDKPVAGGV